MCRSEVERKSIQVKEHVKKLVQVSIPVALPNQVQVQFETLCAAVFHFRCAFVSAISYRAEIFVMGLMVQR